MLEYHRTTILKMCSVLLDALHKLQEKYPDSFHVNRWLPDIAQLQQFTLSDESWAGVVRDWDRSFLPDKEFYLNRIAYATGMLYGIRQAEQYWRRRLTQRDIEAVDVVVYRQIYPNGVVWSDASRNGDRANFFAYGLSDFVEKFMAMANKNLTPNKLAKHERAVTMLACGRQKKVQASAAI